PKSVVVPAGRFAEDESGEESLHASHRGETEHGRESHRGLALRELRARGGALEAGGEHGVVVPDELLTVAPAPDLDTGQPLRAQGEHSLLGRRGRADTS